MKQVRRFRMVFLFSLLVLIIGVLRPELRASLTKNLTSNFGQMLAVIPPIFILLGLLDQWVPREVVMKYMGKGSGLRGIVLSIVLGASSAGPLYGAFPFAAVMLEKGVRLGNVILFLSAWATLKVPMFLFEVSALGWRFASLRWLLNVPVILFIAYLTEHLLSDSEKQQILANRPIS